MPGKTFVGPHEVRRVVYSLASAMKYQPCAVDSEAMLE